MKEEILKQYELWCEKTKSNKEMNEALLAIKEDERAIEDAFYRNLEFGTGGLRGVIGAGTNRMNIFTVAKASQGLAEYVVSSFEGDLRKIAISYDSRIKSDVFARVAAGVFAANGIKVFMYSELMPTPCLSFAVRELGCAAGIMVTASHNPAKYNGYKVYGSDGCQITTAAAAEILEKIEQVDIFDGIKQVDFEAGIASGQIEYIAEAVYSKFIEEIKKQSLLTENDSVDKNVAIVYSPLNGTGLKPVTRALKEMGYTNSTVVEEQRLPDGNFPTCPYPNPEIKEAMSLGMEYAKKNNADLLIATDPDCDRVGIAVKNSEGEYVLLSGNETGCLLLDYICSMRIRNNTMPKEPVAVKTIVTSDLGQKIATKYGVETKNVLTGFKFIGEQIGFLEQLNKSENYIFGFEESFGYLSGSYVRDKDAVNGATLICEMFAYYKSKGISLLEKLEELYKEHGYYLNSLYSYEFEGADGMVKMQHIMDSFRTADNPVPGFLVERVEDFNQGLYGLPKSNVIKFYFEGDISLVVRPSGTEPKIKLYISINCENRDQAKNIEKELLAAVNM